MSEEISPFQSKYELLEMESDREISKHDVDTASENSSLLSPLLENRLQKDSSSYVSTDTSCVSPLHLSQLSDSRSDSLNSSQTFSPLYLLHMEDNKRHFKRVTFKTDPTIIPTPTPSQEKFVYEPSSKVLCPHTGCSHFLPVQSGRLTAHFKHCHSIIPSRSISRGLDEDFTLNMPIKLHNSSCFNVLRVFSDEPFPSSTLFLMITRFSKMINYRTCYRILIWILADEILTPVNVVLTFEGETTQCRARTIDHPPDISNCLCLSRKAIKKFHISGGKFTLRVL